MDGEHDVNVERIRAEMRRYEASCGCELGSVFAIASLLAYLAHQVLGQGTWPGWDGTGWAAVWVISLSVVGKLMGLGHARVRLGRLRAQLDRELEFVSRVAAPRPHVTGRVRFAGGPAGPLKE